MTKPLSSDRQEQHRFRLYVHQEIEHLTAPTRAAIDAGNIPLAVQRFNTATKMWRIQQRLG